MTFNPFADVDCRRGAPMGRAGCTPTDYRGGEELFATAGEIDSDRGQDKGGAYWGMGKPLWAVHNSDGSLCHYVRADTAADAIAVVNDALFRVAV